MKTIDKATVLGQNADGDETKTPAGIMVNPDGDWVIHEPDKAAWEQFQAKAKSNATATKAAPEGDKEVQERGLECPIDKKMFIDPMKTPCCEKTYCNDCITNALIESDFVCPGCKSDGVLLDDLKTDAEAVERMKAFIAEKDGKGKAGSQSPKGPEAAKTPTATGAGDDVDTKATPIKAGTKSPSPPTDGKAADAKADETATTTGQAPPSAPANGDPAQVVKKRPADELLENPKIPKAPKAMQQKQQNPQQATMGQIMNMTGMPGMPGMPAMAGMPGMSGMSGMPGMPMPGMNPMGGMPMMFPGMPMMNNFGMPNMPMGMMNPMMNPMMGNGMPGGFPSMNNGFVSAGNHNNNSMWGQGMGGHNNAGPQGGPHNMGPGQQRMMNQGGFQPHPQHHQQQQQQQQHGHQNHFQQGQQGQQGQQQFNNQQQQQQQQHGPGFKNFSHQPADDEDAYFRKPVNPHRHQNRQRRVRPSDYREL